MRILETTSPIYEGPEGNEIEVEMCNIAIDLEEVVLVRTVDFATPGDSVVQFACGRQVRVREPYSTILMAWKAYREGADMLTRIRN